MKNVKFIHIGKCGGTSVRRSFRLQQYHHARNYKDDENYIIWIRNPIKRFVSAFYFSYNLIHTNVSNFDMLDNKPTLSNCLAPYRIRYKMKHGHTFTERYDYLINYFKTANELAESITSQNIEKKNLALELLNHKSEHIKKGIGWYLYNGDFIEKNYNKIIFVGSVENITDDMKRLGNLLKKKMNDDKKNLRKNNNDNDKFLSPKAIKNILNFYKDTDYKALQKLVEYKFITKDLFEKYHHYNMA